ncbi:DNA-binding protein SMUBP-2 [Nitzschia inconspicua]|uniref:DNA-binding protein SMUBP-2 n=1 Tax=Nitzschia inconspicua TaxID=303405 RepID=A0A9K3KF36_9STRA|nr:DNA-binding protein SMUBP-2 [Nitzschia inconspicua]
MTDSNIREFVAKQRQLLELELQASNLEEQDCLSNNTTKNTEEREEERVSHVLGQLEASEVSVGMYGRTVVELTLWAQAAATNPVTLNDDDQQQQHAKASSTSGLRLLPAHRFTVGDEVEIHSKHGRNRNKNKAVGGVISAVSDTLVAVALFQDRSAKQIKGDNNNSSNNNSTSKKAQNDNENDENDILNMAPLTLVPKSSIEVHKKLIAALDKLERYGVDHPIAGPVIRAMFPDNTTGSDDNLLSPPIIQQQKIEPFNPNLDQSQLEAIDFALQPQRPFALIHGPPGTGKTTTVAELIRQAVHHYQMRVLVTAPSNVAVDNILERLVAAEETASGKSHGNNKKRLRTVRLGHPARIKSSILSHSLEHLVQTSEGTEIVQDVRQELQSFLKILANPKARGQDKRVAYRQIKSLRKEVRVREEKVVQELITTADVVLATTVGAGAGILDKFNDSGELRDGSSSGGFDLVVIDEAAQALEASCWIPILRGRKVVLAGDHKQLPPTIKSRDRRAVEGLGNTLFERLMKLYAHDTKRISRMLQIQYRMNHNIADWASQAMYNGELLTHDSVRDRTLGQLLNVNENCRSDIFDDDDDDLRQTILVLVDTAGCEMHEMETAAGSRFNEGEAMIVNQHVRKVLALGVQENQIAVITPYNGQVELLRSMLLPDFPKLEIRSVDGFQGGEREAVILSLVRSSDRGGHNGIGFLRDDRRQNVAVTRAKRHLAVVCDTETVTKSPFIANLVDWIEKHGEHRSAVEYIVEAANDKSHEDDLRRAEADLMKLVESSYKGNSKSKKPPLSGAKDSPPTKIDKELEASKRKALMDKISNFFESGNIGEEMALSSELSSYDRRLVHEFAEQLGLGHRSEGTEGVDRRIVVTIQTERAIAVIDDSNDNNGVAKPTSNKMKATKDETNANSAVASNFAALALEESDSDEEVEIMMPHSGDGENELPAETTLSNVPTTNSLLAQLVKERAEREEKNTQQTTSIPKTATTTLQKKKKKKGEKLGGSGPRKPAAPSEVEFDNADDLDDMAFLDAQIEKVQNAHGRKVVGSGKQYKTIVNGILNARPEPTGKAKNSKASSMLQSKLREAESSRKKKTQKKK